MDDIKNTYIKNIVNSCGLIHIPKLLEIDDTHLKFISEAHIDYGKYHELSYLDPLLRYVWEDISYLKYKAFYAYCVVPYMTRQDEKQVCVYEASYIRIFDSLLKLKHKATEKIAMLG